MVWLQRQWLPAWQSGPPPVAAQSQAESHAPEQEMKISQKGLSATPQKSLESLDASVAVRVTTSSCAKPSGTPCAWMVHHSQPEQAAEYTTTASSEDACQRGSQGYHQ